MRMLLEQQRQGNVARDSRAPQAFPQHIQVRDSLPKSMGSPASLDLCRCSGNFHDEYCPAQYFVIDYTPISIAVGLANIFVDFTGIDAEMPG